ncbi:MAG: hypothetical protein J1E95_07205 [Muribaculaceae bacterium]|nr:hypothetical protein [Muribaculaceae bacterium]
MKKILLPVFALMTLLPSCTYDTSTGEHHVSIMFWFFIAGISISLIIILAIIFRKKK